MRTTVTLRLALALALAGVAAVSALRCPDGTSECPSNATCCVTPDGSWGCCPMPQVWSRARGGHRPAAATVVTGSGARSTGYGTSLSPYVPAPGTAHFCSQCPRAVPKPLWLTMTPGAPSSQRAGTPHLLSPMTCGDTELGGWLTVTPCPPAAPLRQVTCPDGRSACPDGATCCQLPSAQYGCCPLQNVSVSPCPHTAPRGGGGLSPAVLSPAAVPPRRLGWDWDPPGAILGAQGTLAVTIRLSPVGDVKCDDQMSCPDGNTCCRLSSGAWGCCPLEEVGGTGGTRTGPQGRDGQDASPRDVPREPCPLPGVPHAPGGLGAGVPVPWVGESVGVPCPPVSPVPDRRGHPTCPQVPLKTPARGRAGDVKCDDETSCPDGNTCCRLSSGAWGCCPLEQAVCCPDHVHCCPQGYTCDPQGGTCLKGGVRLPWLSKTPARGRGGDVKCDDQMSCPDGNTCCQLSSGAWGCCPLEQAVCCKDHQHCCPRGYTCNAATQSCEKLLAATPLRFPVPTGPPLSPPRPVATIPADTARACPPGQRCCRSKDGSWARCPFAQGSCCEDGRRCCPAGYRCARGGRECWPQRWDVGGGISSRTLL
uniref:Granulin precursor n=1 Tax=Anas platyrhynchos TaxID=8839 RepID=A0A8B9TB40_ANAPL